MSVEQDYAKLAERLLVIYSRRTLQSAVQNLKKAPKRPYTETDRRFLSNLQGLANVTDRYRNASDLDRALDVIDLASIYAGVDKREEDQAKSENEEANSDKLGYEDFLVLELLQYFKHTFFKWITIPECPICKKGSENIVSVGVVGPPLFNPDEITRIEQYQCQSCRRAIDFPRINSPVKLLDTREGRCGEWVNCFMLILRALLGSNAGIRYVWNYEDHVWCEYYSSSLKRWVHLDPCEAAFDEPTLYCQNWGKRMSWAIGINDGYMIDLSDKYITIPDKQVPKDSVISNILYVKEFISRINQAKLQKYYIENIDPVSITETEKLLKLYNEVILLHNQELLTLTTKPSKSRGAGPSTTQTKGRQTGGTEWTKARGEDGA